jgi:superfamily I DNA and/or RNA helicase
MAQRRAYISLKVAQLRELFDASRDKSDIVSDILAELKHRTTPTAKALEQDIQVSLQERVAPASKVPYSDSTSHPNEKTPSVVETKAVSRRASILEKREIRPIGSYPELPPTFIYPLNNNEHPEITNEMSRVSRYVAFLKLYVQELKSNGSGYLSIQIHSGGSLKVEGGKVILRFEFEGEGDDLVENSFATLKLGGRRYETKLVSVDIEKKTLAIELDEIPEEPLDKGELQIDSTSLLRQLAERFEKLGDKESVPLNTELADNLLKNIGGPLSDGISVVYLEGEDRKARVDQRRAIQVAVTHDISFIDGPPGTGKTTSLASVIYTLFKAGERTLIVSNTHNAVDQILLRLLKADKERSEVHGDKIFEEETIIRVGRIVDKELSEYAEQVELNTLAEKKNLALRQEKLALEEGMELSRNRIAYIRECLGLFKAVAESVRSRDAIQLKLDEGTDIISRLDAIISTNEKHLAEWKEKAAEKLNANVIKRLVLPSEERINKEITQAESQIKRSCEKISSIKSDQRKLREDISGLEEEIDSATKKIDGMSVPTLSDELQKKETLLSTSLSRIREIEKQVEETRDLILRAAKVVGATVTKLFVSPKWFTNFDNIIIDEASMVITPALYHAAGMANKRVIICGDPRQLPPIVSTKDKAVFEELGRDIYSLTRAAHDPERYAALDTQQRFPQEICSVICPTIYDNLKTSYRPSSDTTVSEGSPFKSPVIFIDTQTLFPFCGQSPFGSRYSLIHAIIVRNVVKRLAREVDSGGALDKIGVTAAYKAQVQQIASMLEDDEEPLRTSLYSKGSEKSIKIGTIHSFQGAEKEFMIMDVIDSAPMYQVSPFLQGENPYEHTGPKLLNVAITRSKGHLIVVANRNFLDLKMPEQSTARQLFYRLQTVGTMLDAKEVMEWYPIDWGKVINPILPIKDVASSGIASGDVFERALFADLQRANHSVVIFSAFATLNRISALRDNLAGLVRRGVRVRCVTRASFTNKADTPENLAQAFSSLKAVGCILDFRADIHEKAVIIDQDVVWFGSLNPLSYTLGTSELMTRLEGEGTVATYIKALKLPSRHSTSKFIWEQENPLCPQCKDIGVFIKKNGGFFMCPQSHGPIKLHGSKSAADSKLPQKGPPCPQCGKSTKLRSSSRGPFYGCSDYPACKGTAPIENVENDSESETAES